MPTFLAQPSGGTSQTQLLLGVLGVIVVIFGAYYTTAVVARRAGRAQQGRVVRTLDRFAVGKDKMFCLLEMGDSLYLIGMSEGAVAVIDKLTGSAAQEIREACAQDGGNILTRGAGFFARRAQGRRFDSQLRQARARMEQAEAEGDGAQPGLSFAREEDDIDAMLRQISARKNRRPEDDGEGQP